jgi:hypothetical protein
MNKSEHSAEQIKIPEIVAEREEGLERFSRLSQSQRQEVIAAADGDEEAAFWAGLAFGYPEREQEIIEQFKKYKPHITDSENLLHVTNQFLEESFVYGVEEIGGTVADPESRVQKLFSYFKPREIPARIVVVPSDNLTAPTSGRSWQLGGDGYVVSHSTNPDNFDHETLHLIINPMVEKFETILSEGQKKSILKMGAEKLQEKYGDDWMPMLCEELINTHKECVERNEPPETFESFFAKIQTLTDEDIRAVLLAEGRGDQLRELGIGTRQELFDKAREFYERYIQNRLRDSLYRIYQDYRSSDEDFEEALRRNIERI